MKIKTLIISLLVSITTSWAAVSSANTSIKLTISNHSNHNMKFKSSQLTRMTADSDFEDIDNNNTPPNVHVLTFDDDKAKIIEDSAEIKYFIECGNGVKDLLTIIARAKMHEPPLKVISYDITIDKHIIGYSDGDSGGDSTPHCSKLRDPTTPMNISNGEAKVEVVPNEQAIR